MPQSPAAAWLGALVLASFSGGIPAWQSLGSGSAQVGRASRPPFSPLAPPQSFILHEPQLGAVVAPALQLHPDRARLPFASDILASTEPDPCIRLQGGRGEHGAGVERLCARCSNPKVPRYSKPLPT